LTLVSAVGFTKQVSAALKALKAFNLQHIYLNQKLKPNFNKIESIFNLLFDRYLTDMERAREDSIIFTEFLLGMSEQYKQSKPAEIVRDFISGMTDQYFLRQCPESLRPKKLK